MRTIPLPALTTLIALTAAVLAFILYAALPAQAQSTPTDYDSDDDNLIEVSTLDQLNAIRWDLDGNGDPASANTSTYYAAFPNPVTTTRMGCAATCTGYELDANLNFDADNSGSVTGTDPYLNWTPILAYASAFNGNGNTISNLTVSSTFAHTGLFGSLIAGASIRDVGIIAPNIRATSSNHSIGALVGINNGTISASYARGGSIALTSGNALVGGLVGTNAGSITASYSTSTIDAGARPNSSIGGLVGLNNAGTISASYAAGPISNTDATTTRDQTGGLVGRFFGAASAATNTYCDTTIHSTTTQCVGGRTSGATIESTTVPAKTTAELQSPTTYTGIYAHWNVDIDSDTFPDQPWNFGATNAYPTLKTPTQRQADPVIDYDPDNDNLINIDSLHKLNAIRYDLDGDGLPDNPADYPAYAGVFLGGNLAATNTRMGCAEGCAGYELTQNLNFDTDGGGVSSTDPYPNWPPIGPSSSNDYEAEFNGNGYTISNLTMTNFGFGVGLFGYLGRNSVVRDLGMINSNVRGHKGNIGNLAGYSRADIIASYSQGGTITAATTTSRLLFAGGLIGSNAAGNIYASYSNASVTSGTSTNARTGGLIGSSSGGRITASYAFGPVSGTGSTTQVGGFVGVLSLAAVTDSYCDTTVSTPTPCIGSAGFAATANAVQPQTTAQLQNPTTYTGIYANWNLSLDGDDYPDNPWNFRTTTQYPALNTPTQRQTTIDYDTDNDGLIDINTLDQLNAIRHDLNGDGLPDSTSTGIYPAYAGAFPAGDLAAPSSTRMGCAAGCAGYELSANLNFDADGVGGVTTTDPYPNWTPIGGNNNYTAIFDGNGRTITNLTIDASATVAYTGLFGSIGSGSDIRNLGLIDPSVISRGSIVGALVGGAFAGGEITASYVQGGSVAMNRATGGNVGGMVGFSSADIRAAYSTASVAGATATNANIGGLLGFLEASANIIASYAAGPVTGTTTASNIGGLVGQATGLNVEITDSYCDTTVGSATTSCIGSLTSGAAVTADGKTATELQTPNAYTGIYQNWNINLNTGGTTTPSYPWYFGQTTEYPTLNTPQQRQEMRTTWTPPPPPPRPENPEPGNGNGDGNGQPGDGGGDTGGDTAQPPAPPTTITAIETVETYDAASAHPEIYHNPQYQMTANCQTHNPHPETGNPQSATITFNLGNYDGPILLILSIWRNQRYLAYETQDIPLPTLQRQGQTATITVETNPAQTRFRLDGRRHSLPHNLLQGYANCHTDDP